MLRFMSAAFGGSAPLTGVVPASRDRPQVVENAGRCIEYTVCPHQRQATWRSHLIVTKPTKRDGSRSANPLIGTPFPRSGSNVHWRMARMHSPLFLVSHMRRLFSLQVRILSKRPLAKRSRRDAGSDHRASPRSASGRTLFVTHPSRSIMIRTPVLDRLLDILT